MSFTPYAEGRTLDFNLGTQPSAGTGASYVSLHSASPPTAANEITGGAYARQQYAYSKSGNTPTVAANSAIISFPTATAAWGTIAAFALWDASTNGNMITGNAVTTQKSIGAGDTAQFQTGTLTVSMN